MEKPFNDDHTAPHAFASSASHAVSRVARRTTNNTASSYTADDAWDSAPVIDLNSNETRPTSLDSQQASNSIASRRLW